MADSRQKCVELTHEGNRMVAKLRPIWAALECAVKEAMAEGGANILEGIDALETAFARKSMYTRLKEKQSESAKTDFDLVPYEVAYKQAFYDLNRAWLDADFKMEAIDEVILGDPEAAILSKGGEIFFTVAEGKAVGTVAMKVVSDGVFELTKLGVDPTVQRGGMGRALCEKVIERFKARDGSKLFLETNTVLTPAIKLYERLGFVAMDPPEPSPYERSNYYMEWRDDIA